MPQLRMLLCVVLLTTVTNSDGAAAQDLEGGVAEKFVGMWRLVSIVDSKGQVPANTGAHPTGFIVYDQSGNMTVQIMPDVALRRKFVAADPTPTEAKAAITGYTAYFGTWSVDEKAGTITHHLKGSINPGGPGVDFVRKFQLTGNRVTLIPVSNGGLTRVSGNKLTWEKVK